VEVLRAYAVDVEACKLRVAHEPVLDTVDREQYKVVGDTAADRCSAWGPVDEESGGGLPLGCL